MAERLKTVYRSRIVPKLMADFEYKNRLQVARIEKIVINRGLGDASQNTKMLDSCLRELALIAGQRGVVSLAQRRPSQALNFEKRRPSGCR